MWNSKLAECVRAYRSVVLTVVEAPGYPISIRCEAEPGHAEEIILLHSVPAWAQNWRGPACILFHRHNERLEGLHELLIKGVLDEHGGSLVLRPTAFVTGTGSARSDQMPHAGAPLNLVKFILVGQRNARAYLRKRGAPWPPINFDELLLEQTTPDAGR